MAHASREQQTSNLLLGGLAPGEYAAVISHLTPVRLERGQILEEAGERVGEVYFPYAGMVSLLAATSEGDLVEVMTVGREGAVGLTSGLGSNIALSRAVVQLPGAAGRIEAPRWTGLVEQSSALRRLVVRYNDIVLWHAQQSVACNALHDVEARLCRWLLEARDRTGAEILPLSQEFLADRLAIRRTTVTLVARRLQAAGLIRCSRGTLYIRDAVGLEECACDCYHMLRGAFARLLDL